MNALKAAKVATLYVKIANGSKELGTVAVSTGHNSYTPGAFGESASQLLSYNGASIGAVGLHGVAFAKPNPGYEFVGWSTDENATYSSNGLTKFNSYEIEISSSASSSPGQTKTVYAVFKQIADADENGDHDAGKVAWMAQTISNGSVYYLYNSAWSGFLTAQLNVSAGDNSNSFISLTQEIESATKCTLAISNNRCAIQVTDNGSTYYLSQSSGNFKSLTSYNENNDRWYYENVSGEYRFWLENSSSGNTSSRHMQAKSGNSISFGRFKMDNNNSNDFTPTTWMLVSETQYNNYVALKHYIPANTAAASYVESDYPAAAWTKIQGYKESSTNYIRDYASNDFPKTINTSTDKSNDINKARVYLTDSVSGINAVYSDAISKLEAAQARHDNDLYINGKDDYQAAITQASTIIYGTATNASHITKAITDLNTATTAFLSVNKEAAVSELAELIDYSENTDNVSVQFNFLTNYISTTARPALSDNDLNAEDVVNIIETLEEKISDAQDLISSEAYSEAYTIYEQSSGDVEHASTYLESFKTAETESDLVTLMQNYEKIANPNPGATFDMTFLLDNPTVPTSWLYASGNSPVVSDGGVKVETDGDATYYENDSWILYQTKTIPAGKYTFTATAKTGNSNILTAWNTPHVKIAADEALSDQINDNFSKKSATFTLAEGKEINLGVKSDTWCRIAVIKDVSLTKSHQTTTYTVTTNSDGWATFCSPYNTTFEADDEDVEMAIYTAEYNSTTPSIDVTRIEDIDVIPANTGIIIKTSEGSKSCTFTSTDTDADDLGENDLYGTVISTARNTTTGLTTYVLSNKGGSVSTAFYPFVGTNIPANKAYLTILNDEAVVPIRIMDEIENTTPIESIETDNTPAKLDVNAPMYNVLGMTVNASYKGVVIQNGNKFYIP